MNFFQKIVGLFLVFCLFLCCKDINDEKISKDPDLENYSSVSLQSQLTEAQPMTGIVLWNDVAKENDEKYGKSISLEFAYCLPCKVVTGKTADNKITYDWASFEALLDDIKSRNHQAVIRFRYEYPNGTDVDGIAGTTAVPQYIKDLENYTESYSSNPNGDGPTYYADWSNFELQWFTKQFYTDFSNRYDSDPRLAFLEVGFGHWSEYHIYGTNLQFGINFPSYEYQAEFLTHLSSVFENLQWLISIDASDSTYSPIIETKELMDLNFGLFDDSFMHSEHDLAQGEGYNEQCWNAIGQSIRWETSPCGGEISYYLDTDQVNFLNPNGMHGVTWEQAAAKYHMSFVIANDAVNTLYGTSERFLEASLNSGYRFKIEEFWTSENSSWIKIKNIGIAPIYKDAYIAVNNIRSEYSLKDLKPNMELWIEVKAGGLNPILTIESDYLVGRNIGFEAECN